MERMMVITAAVVLLFGSAGRIWSPGTAGITSHNRRLPSTKDGLASTVLVAQAKTNGDDGTPLPARTADGISTSPSASATAAAIADYEQCVTWCEVKGDMCRNAGRLSKDCASSQAQCFRSCAAKYPH